MRRRYLVVDDNRAYAENLAEILEGNGSDAVIFTSAESTLAAGNTHRFDALVTDIRMSGMNGVGLLHALRATDPGLPAIMMSAYSDDAALELARQEGLLAVLPKPVPLRQLLALLQAARRGGLVAVVEDNLALRDNLTEVLRMHGFTSVSVDSAHAALQLECTRPFAAVVDVRLPDAPDGAGVDALNRRFPGVPVIAMSAYDVAASLQGTFVEFLPKPFVTSSLVALLDGLYRQQSVS